MRLEDLYLTTFVISSKNGDPLGITNFKSYQELNKGERKTKHINFHLY